MRIEVRLDGTAPMAWHVRLLQRLAERPDTTVAVDATAGRGGLPVGARLLFQLETVLHGLERPSLAAQAAPSDLARYPKRSGTPDRVVDVSGRGAQDGPAVWRLDVDGAPCEEGLLAAVVAGRTPHAAIRAGGAVVASARLGTEGRGTALTAIEDYLARVITLIVAALDGGAGRTGASDDAPAGGAPSLGSLARFEARALAHGAKRRIYYLTHNAPHWRIGWRRVAGPDVLDLLRHPSGGWHDLPDDASRFYADPFPIEREGVVTLFMEDFEHRRGKGLISALGFDAQGPVGRPEPVLDLSYHLSYPFVFEAEGEVWMVPESCAARGVDLYRATRFPGGWVHEARLVDGIVASDATLLRHAGRWWMFATVRDGHGAFSDALHLWSAADFRGPWTPHRRNPVLIDIAAARPAGRIVERGGALLRPVQDCRQGYGAALGIARILRLDDEAFEQRIEATLAPGAVWPGRRLHTLNRAGPFEFIDGSRRALRRPWPLAPGRPAPEPKRQGRS